MILPRVYVTRHLPQSAIDLLAQHTQLEFWPGELPLINRDALERLKPHAILVHTAHGPVVDTDALVEVLRRKPIGAALDVTDPEPLPADHPLLELPNALVTPHIASATAQTRTRMALVAVKNLLAAPRGERHPFLVNPDAWRG